MRIGTQRLCYDPPLVTGTDNSSQALVVTSGDCFVS